MGWRRRSYDKAIADLTEAIRLDPKFASAFVQPRYTPWHDKKEYDKAIKDYTEAIRLDPKFADVYNRRGKAWSEKNEYDKAIKDFDMAIELNPQNTLNSVTWRDAALRGRQELLERQKREAAAAEQERQVEDTRETETRQDVVGDGNIYQAWGYLPLDPSTLPADVVAGLRQFDCMPWRTDAKVAMQKGFDEWLRRRCMGELKGLTREMQAASTYFEKVLAPSGCAPDNRTSAHHGHTGTKATIGERLKNWLFGERRRMHSRSGGISKRHVRFPASAVQ